MSYQTTPSSLPYEASHEIYPIQFVGQNMGTKTYADETTVSDRGAVTVPSGICDQIDIQPGDKIRWLVDEDGEIWIVVFNQRDGAFDDFEPIDVGETNAAEDHNLHGAW